MVEDTEQDVAKPNARHEAASSPHAVTGSITRDSNGIPMMEKPPPNAPFIMQIRKTPAKATRIVVIVNSMGSASFRMLEHGDLPAIGVSAGT
jgi:hypothetical protein